MSYSVREVARLLELSETEVRRCHREGLLATPWLPGQSADEVRLGFQDLVLLRSVAALAAEKVPTRRVRRALRTLRERLPEGQSLSSVAVGAEGGNVVVREGERVWDAHSQQFLLPLARGNTQAEQAKDGPAASPVARPLQSGAAEVWFERGCALDEAQPKEAIRAYRETLARDATHVGALTNLGRLFHEAGELAQAELHFRRAVELRPEDPTLAFNLGVVLEDRGQCEAAIGTYARALFLDPAFGDAHFNLARLYEERGDRLAALRHLSAYRNLQAS